jgi:hypothetical protein
MGSNMKLTELAAMLYAELREAVIPKEVAVSICHEVAKGSTPIIETVKEYQQAWTICKAVEEVLTAEDDNSEAGQWHTRFAHAVIDFEDTYKAQYGHYPLNAAKEDWMGPVGHA